MLRGIQRSERKTQISALLPISDVEAIEKLLLAHKFTSLGHVIREGVKLLLSRPDVQQVIQNFSYGEES